MVGVLDQDLDILEVDMVEDLAAEEMQEMTEVEERSMETVAIKIAMVDVVDGNRYKT